jgi:hypothetical protein
MKIESIRCDVCKYEVFYKDDKGEKVDFQSFVSIKAEGAHGSTEGHYCSPNCLIIGVWETTVYGTPLEKDIIDRLEKQFDWKISKNQS